jgi:hypothetical protein
VKAGRREGGKAGRREGGKVPAEKEMTKRAVEKFLTEHGVVLQRSVESKPEI